LRISRVMENIEPAGFSPCWLCCSVPVVSFVVTETGGAGSESTLRSCSFSNVTKIFQIYCETIYLNLDNDRINVV
ncbi:MAG: hypothetical protein FWG53_11390, partial [Clostridiales bacterium]|nr:hypothetical protein [Clostridiales bacterium]